MVKPKLLVTALVDSQVSNRCSLGYLFCIIIISLIYDIKTHFHIVKPHKTINKTVISFPKTFHGNAEIDKACMIMHMQGKRQLLQLLLKTEAFTCCILVEILSRSLNTFSSTEPKSQYTHALAFVVVIVVVAVYTMFKHILLNRLSNMRIILRKGEPRFYKWFYINGLSHMTKMAAKPMFDRKNLRNLLLLNRFQQNMVCSTRD